MNRKINFRGKPIKYPITVKNEKGEFVIPFIYGGYNCDYCYGGCPEGKDYIIEWNSFGMGFNEEVLVEKQSVGQFTGAEDKNKKDIYEGDIIKNIFNGEIQILLCKWSDFNCGFVFLDKKGIDRALTDCEVIGNIIENPELLEE
jgi:hypothetical protein